MPTYEYCCTSCGALWETEQRISDDPLDSCPHCDAKRITEDVNGWAITTGGPKRLVSGGNGLPIMHLWDHDR